MEAMEVCMEDMEVCMEAMEDNVGNLLSLFTGIALEVGSCFE